jgi:hypothetical protein
VVENYVFALQSSRSTRHFQLFQSATACLLVLREFDTEEETLIDDWVAVEQARDGAFHCMTCVSSLHARAVNKLSASLSSSSDSLSSPLCVHSVVALILVATNSCTSTTLPNNSIISPSEKICFIFDKRHDVWVKLTKKRKWWCTKCHRPRCEHLKVVFPSSEKKNDDDENENDLENDDEEATEVKEEEPLGNALFYDTLDEPDSVTCTRCKSILKAKTSATPVAVYCQTTKTSVDVIDYICSNDACGCSYLRSPNASIRASRSIAVSNLLLEYFTLFFETSRVTFTSFVTTQTRFFDECFSQKFLHKSSFITAWFRYVRYGIWFLCPFFCGTFPHFVSLLI